MTPFEGLLDDKELAAVLTYVRNSFGNQATAIEEAQVTATRANIRGKKGFYLAHELNQ
jgi:mono/diheme cytochrome c family protein